MKHIPRLASYFSFPMLVLCAHLVASKILGLYLVFPNIDIPFHFAGGFSIAFMSTQILSYFEREQIIPAINKYLFLILIFSLTATATVIWEFAEFTADQILNANIQVSLANTMRDQFMGILGGMTFLFIRLYRFANSETNGIKSTS